MHKLFYSFLILFCCCPFVLFGQHSLSIEINNIKAEKGSIYLAVYQNAQDFLKSNKHIFRSCVQGIEGPKVQCLFEDLPAGDYAVSVFQDKNGNGELDTNWMGIPKEPYGFSNNPKALFRAPRFDECKFSCKAAMTLQVSLD